MKKIKDIEFKQLFNELSNYTSDDWKKIIGKTEIKNLNNELNDWLNNIDTSDDDIDDIKNLLSLLEKVSYFVPWGNFKTKIQQLSVKIKKLYLKKPVILFQGRRGSGKSSLLNAILGENKAKIGDFDIGTYMWEIYDHADITMIDARGYGDTENSDEVIEEHVKEIVKQYPIDLILFTHKAEETSARITEEINKLNSIVKIIDDDCLVILPVMTQCDKIDTRMEFSADEKLKKIEGAKYNFYQNLKTLNKDQKSRILIDEIIPVACEPNLNGDLKYKWWFNVEGIIRHIFKVLPERSKIKFSYISELTDIKESLIDEVIFIFSVLTGIIGAVPIPFADMPVLSATQLYMIKIIKKISFSNRGNLTIAGTVVIKSGFGLKAIARSFAKLTGVGNVINSVIAYSGTYTLGKLAKKYYFYNQDLTSNDLENFNSEKELEI